MRVVHGISALFFGLAVGISLLAGAVRAEIGPFARMDFTRPGGGEWAVLIGVCGCTVIGSLVWNGLQFQRLNREARSIFKLVEGAREQGGVYYGLNEAIRGLGVSRTRFVIRGWAFLLRGRKKRPGLYLRIGDRRIEPEWEDRVDVADAFMDRFDIPRRCGFNFRFQTGFGLKRIELRMEGPDGDALLERFWRISLRRRAGGSKEFAGWFEKNGECGDRELENLSKRVGALKAPPRISILFPVYNAPPPLLEAAVRSVIAQVYPHWELCMVDDASSEEATREAVRQLSGLDGRIRVRYRSYNGHISEATNTAFSYAGGDYVGLLDHDDELTPNALAEVALALEAHPGAKWVYSDEDKIDPKGNLLGPYFKPDYDPELLMRQNFICHFTVIERGLFDRAGGMRVGLEGSQDWDCFLRLSRLVRPSEVVHIPKILYHWRMAPGSSANTVGDKNYSVRAAERAITEHLGELGISARPKALGGMYWSVWPELPEPAPGLVLIDLEAGGDWPVTSPDDGSILLIGCDAGCLEAVGEASRETLCRTLMLRGVGAVGPMVTGERGLLVHAGTYLDPRGGCLRPFRGESPEVTGMGWRAQLTQTQSGLNCPVLAVRAAALSGLDPTTLLRDVPLNWQPLALSLALGERGWRCLYVPEARVELGRDWPQEEGAPFPELLRARYAEWFDRDPCFNPNLSLEAEDLRPTSEPRPRYPVRGRDYR